VGLAWLDEPQLHTVRVAPAQHLPPAELLAVLGPDEPAIAWLHNVGD
jgi:hypothetical protein